MVKLISLISLFFIASCSLPMGKRSSGEFMAWSELQESKGRLAGEVISLCGWFVADRDNCILLDKQEDFSEEIWVRPKSDICLPLRVFSGPTHSWAQVTGIYHHGDSYGLFGLFDSAITNADVVLRSDCKR